MDERRMQFWVGVVFLATFLIAGILLVTFGNLPTFVGRTYKLEVLFDHAGGVAKDTPVLKSGIRIGWVEDVKLVDEDARVLITLRIQAQRKIYQHEECYITRDLLGNTAVVFVPVPTKPGRGVPVAAGARLEGKVSDDPTGLKRALESPIHTVTQTGEALKEASDQLKAAAKKVEEILDTEQQRIHEVLANAADSLKAVRNVLGDEETQRRLAEAMQKLPNTLDSMSSTFRTADESLRLFTARSERDGKTAVERMVDTIEMTERTLRKFSEPSEPGRAAPAEQIAAAMEDIGEITALLRTVMARIERGEGSLGALVNDRQLYDRLNRAARNIEQISRDLRPIIDDARVFSDKVARHPGVIVRDAIRPGVGIK